MPTVEMNIWAVLVCAAINMVLGMVWYSPKVFGTAWMKGLGKSMADIEKVKGKGKGMGSSYALMAVSAVVMAYVLAHFVDFAQAKTVAEGLQTGLWAWLGFVGPVMLGGVLWEGKSWKFYCISAGYYLVSLLIFGALLATWA